jgi:hypothetical protein
LAVESGGWVMRLSGGWVVRIVQGWLVACKLKTCSAAPLTSAFSVVSTAVIRVGILILFLHTTGSQYPPTCLYVSVLLSLYVVVYIF